MSKTATRSPKSRLAGRGQGTQQVEVKDYRYKEKRKNNPSAGLATYNFKEIKKVNYSYDPHLDPRLDWAGKAEHAAFEVDTVSLHIHERISTQAILKAVQHREAWRQERLFAEPELAMDKQIEFYKHEMDWTNRLILGDSLLVMNSLLERELMAGKVQSIYFDPPYGIAYNSNFQPTITDRNVKDADDNSLTREPEQIKAYRDTWTLGIHSYLTYLRDRLLLCRELLSETGSIFVQISDENVHLVRVLIDELFGRDNFVSMIAFVRAGAQTGKAVPSVTDYLLWYAKDKTQMKFRKLLVPGGWASRAQDQWIEYADGRRERWNGEGQIPKGARLFTHRALESATGSEGSRFPVELQGKVFQPARGWSTNKEGIEQLRKANRLLGMGHSLRFVVYLDDFDYSILTNNWTDTIVSGFASERLYAVQTFTKVVERCILMTTDPGDLVFDPTCGSGTTAYCAEKVGRRWITCDTSRVAIALARQRIMTSVFPYYKLANPPQSIYGGFLYKTVKRVTLKSIAREELPPTETLYDQPAIEDNKVRVSGPFTVEAIPIASSPIEAHGPSTLEPVDYISTLIGILGKDGITFPKGKKLVLQNLRPLSSSGFLHAEGTVGQNGGVLRVALSFGPRYGPVGVRQVDEALRLANRMGFDILVFAGFAVDPDARAIIDQSPLPKLQVHFANMSPDIILADLLKPTTGSQLFTVFGEPDIRLTKTDDQFLVKLQGVDIYDPITGQVHQSDGKEVPAWFLDEDYDGLTFKASQIFFPKEATRKNPWDKLENALRGNLDKERMETFRGVESLPFRAGKEQRIAVKVVDIRGNEVMVVRSLNGNGQSK